IIPILSGFSFMALLNLFRLKKSGINWLAAIGKVSFSMYVIHFLFAWHIVPRLMKKYFSSMGAEPKLLISLIIVVGFSYVFALMTERFVEAKGISFGKKLVNKLQTDSLFKRRPAGEPTPS